MDLVRILKQHLTPQPARASTVPRLCPEIVDMIIDHLHADLPALHACALVCRAWRPSSQLHIFRSLTLPSSAHLARLLAVLSASAHGTHVRALSLAYPCSLLADDMRALVLALPRLAALALRTAFVADASLPKLAHARLFDRCAGVRALALESCIFGTLRALVAFVRAFPQLEALALVQPCTDDRPGAGDTAPGRARIAVRRLRTGSVPCDETAAVSAERYLAAFDLSVIESATVAIVGVPDLLFLAGLCAHAGPALQDLTITLNPHFGFQLNAQTLAKLSLRHNTRLRTLRVLGVRPARLAARTMFWLAELLGTSTSPHLRSVVYGVQTYGSDAEWIEWERSRGAAAAARARVREAGAEAGAETEVCVEIETIEEVAGTALGQVVGRHRFTL